ncbi:MAG: NTP transferase domain-containing protein [Paracoccaceae bacterium]
MSVATVAVDTPFLPADLVARLRAAAPSGQPALAASHDGAGALRRHPTAALWPVAARRAIAEALARGERRIGQLAADLGAVVVQFDWDRTDPFFNINRPEDLARAERILANG